VLPLVLVDSRAARREARASRREVEPIRLSIVFGYSVALVRYFGKRLWCRKP
jgi:hypothetical protein